LPSTEISLVARGALPRVWGYLLLLDSPTALQVRSESPTQRGIDLRLENAAYLVHATAAGVRVERR
jgi:hypothetical protein